MIGWSRRHRCTSGLSTTDGVVAAHKLKLSDFGLRGMNVRILFLEFFLVSAQGFAVNNSFRSSLEDAGRQYARPGEVVNYTCTVVDNAGTGSTFWKGTAFNCPPSNIISLAHQLFNIAGDSGTCNNGAITAESVGVVDNCYTSRLMVTVSSELNDTTVECTLVVVGMGVGNRTLLVAGTQLQSSVERPCPGDRVIFTCTVPSLAHRWSVPSLNNSRSLLPGDQGQVISDPPFQFSVTEVRTGTSITSTATVTATADLNGTLVVCQDGIGIEPDQNSTINLRGNNDELCVTSTPTPTPTPTTTSPPAPLQPPSRIPTQPPTQIPTQSPLQTISLPTIDSPSGDALAGSIAGGVIGGLIGMVLVILIIIIIVFLIWRTNNSPRLKDEDMKPNRWGKKRHSSEATPNTQELQMDLTYEEVDTPQSQTIQLKENVAYGPVKQSQNIELKENVAYGPVKRN